MIRSLFALAALAFGVAASHAHFVFVVPQKDGKSVQVVFSDDLGPDEAVPITKIAGTKLSVRGATGKAAGLSLKKGEHSYTAELAGGGPAVIYGMTDYGVLQKGSEKPYLLRYHPKAIVGAVPADGGKLGKEVAVEIVPAVAKGKISFQVLAKGKAVAGAEVNVILPKGGKKKLKTDAKGKTEEVEAAGQVGAWARHVEKASGKHNGKAYDEARHYATLVVDVPGK